LQAAAPPQNADESRPYVAVATREGVLVNQHLGEAERVAVFGRNEDGFYLVETRRTPPPGGGSQRWTALAEMLHDCRALLVADAGDAPRAALAEHNIPLYVMEGMIEESLHSIYRGETIRSPSRKQHRCGSGCSGNGLGCS
jgi:nitrogen fixation protein NifB